MCGLARRRLASQLEALLLGHESFFEALQHKASMIQLTCSYAKTHSPRLTLQSILEELPQALRSEGLEGFSRQRRERLSGGGVGFGWKELRHLHTYVVGLHSESSKTQQT